MSGKQQAEAEDRTWLFFGGRILSMDPAVGEPEVLVVRDERIVAAGGRELALRFPHAERVDLGGRTLVPGFIDAHNHLSIAALHPLWADLSAVRTAEELAAALQAQAKREPEAEWIRGAGWNEMETGFFPDRQTLDALGFDRPVILAHYTLHQGVVNSQALDALEIGRSTPDPPGGAIVRGADGEPTGLLIERAWSEAHARSLAAYHDPQRWEELFAARARELLRAGITCVHDAACSPLAEATYRRLAQRRALPISVLMMPHATALLQGMDPARWQGPATGEGDENLRVGAVKLFADGGVAPAIDVHAAGTRLQLGIEFADLREQVLRAAELGFGIAVHAIGNAGVERVLDAFTEVRRRFPSLPHRLRVEHACLLAPAQWRRMAELGVVAVVQPGFLRHVGQAVEHVRFDDASWLPFASIARAGVPLAASSDDPCAPYEPVRTSAFGTTRLTASGNVFCAEEGLSYEEWLRAYTVGAAMAGEQESERGSLTPGKRADLVVLSGALDPFHPPQVDQTWVAGRPVFMRESSPARE